MILKYLAIPALAIGLAACGSPESEKTNNATEEIKAAVCEYTVTSDSAQVYWEAYKLSNKVGVGGKFTNLSYTTKTSTATNLQEILTGSSIQIATTSVNSGDAVRDPKLIKFFFGAMNVGDTISGVINTVEGDNTSGTANTALTMNGVTQDVAMDYSVANGQIKLTASIDVNNFDGSAALEALGVACEAKHTGPDGANVLWPDVTVRFYLPVSSSCD
jgi:polyisoprenoid-binding protein YceI